MTRWLTVPDLCLELGISPSQVFKLFRKGYLKGLGDNIRNLRIIDPGPLFVAQLLNQNLDHFKFITTREMAEVLGISYSRMRGRLLEERRKKHGLRPSGELFVHLQGGRMRRETGGGRQNGHDPVQFFNRLEVRRYLATFGKGSKQERFTYSQIIVKWLRGWLATHETQVSIVDELMHEVTNIPEPDRSRIAAQLWDEFDKVNALLRECAEKSKAGD